jgi:cell division protein FtsL
VQTASREIKLCQWQSDEGNIPMPVNRGQHGFITFSGLLLLLVVAAILFASYKLLPPYIDNYQLQDSIENLARTATYNRLTESEIRNQVLGAAQELGIPLDERQVVVQRSGSSVNIAVQYYIPVDLLVHQMELQFAPSAGNRNIMAK